MPKLWYFLIGGAVALLVAAVLFFSWLPHPALSEVSWLPRWLTRWTDRSGNIRTAVPFILLGFSGGAMLYRLRRPGRDWRRYFAALIALGAVSELGQLFLPLRQCDWRDILWGAGGAAAGLLPWWSALWFSRRMAGPSAGMAVEEI